VVKKIKYTAKKNSFTFAIFICWLRFHLAHKSSDGVDLIKIYVKEYPRLIDYLF
jgi:hypothetical protein